MNLLEDDSNCTDGVLESDCEQPLVEGAQTTETGGNTEAGSVSMNITKPLDLQEELVLTDQEQNEVDQENDIINQKFYLKFWIKSAQRIGIWEKNVRQQNIICA